MPSGSVTDTLPHLAPSPSGKAWDFGSQIRWFESNRGCYAYQKLFAIRLFRVGLKRIVIRF